MYKSRSTCKLKLMCVMLQLDHRQICEASTQRMNNSFSFPAVECGDPPTLASGVTVEAYTSTAVNSDIIFQCQQPNLVPSYRSSVTCGSDGRSLTSGVQYDNTSTNWYTNWINTTWHTNYSAPMSTHIVIVDRYLAYRLVILYTMEPHLSDTRRTSTIQLTYENPVIP